MSEQTNQPAGSGYTDKGKNMTFLPGATPNVKVKSWSIETNVDATTGRESKYLKIVYVHPQPQVDPEEWSTMNELINFPGVPQGQTTVNPKMVKMFVSTINKFTQNFATKDESNDRLLAIFAKLQISDFTFDDVTVLNTQLETLVNGFFDLASKKGLNSVEGTLICGYGLPKEKEGKTTQYLTPMKYGTGGVWDVAFRTSNNTAMPAEKTGGFNTDQEKKYQYWSYTRATSNSNESNGSSSNGQHADPALVAGEEKW